MNPFQLFVQQMGQWRRTGALGTVSGRSQKNDLKIGARSPARGGALKWVWAGQKLVHRLSAWLWKHLRQAQPPRRKDIALRPRSHNTIYYVLAVVLLTSAIGYRFYNEPQLAVGTIAPSTLRAPDLAQVTDAKSTEEQRVAARLGAVPVLKVDQAVNQRIYQSLQQLLDDGDALRQQAGTFPFVSTAALSTATQRYLRQSSEAEWTAAIARVEGGNPSGRPATRLPSSAAGSGSLASIQQLAILELENYRRTVSAEDFSTLKRLILQNRQRYRLALAALSASASVADARDAEKIIYIRQIFNLTDTDWLSAKVEMRRILERVLTQGVAPGLPDTLLENALKAQAIADILPAAVPLAVETLMAAIEPNLTQDVDQTRLQAEQAALAVEPVQVKVRRGELIVRAGETITQADFVLLDYFGLSQRRINGLGLAGFAALISSGIAVFLLVERRFHPGLRRRDYLLITLLLLTTPLLLALGLSDTSLPAIGLLVSSFYGSPLGVVVVGLLSITLPIGMEVSGRHLLASTAGSLLGAVMAGRLRSREELALLGGAVGLTQGAVYLVSSLILSAGTGSVWYSILTASVLQGLMGIAWSVVALGISPYLEQVFDLITPSRLVELANPNRPLLKRLAAEAPGTFQHTLFVATLAEAAARTLGCNVELVRTGTLYHDIGKMHDPQGFIENQMGAPNKHDLIDDPWKSADLIKKHVSQGLLMARKYRLPKAIRAFIPEHQGTMLIAYFFHEAQQRSQQKPQIKVDEATFRYDGPIPQSRETGIVMLADSCEAALRSLKDATPEEALSMVNRILRARWQDNQLVDSGLHRSEMHAIAEIFVQVWQQFNHKRIAYPKAISSLPAVK